MSNTKNKTYIQHPLNHELYQYMLGPRFHAGAPAEIFLPKFQLPVVSFRGRGRVAGQFRTLQPPQVWFTPLSGPAVGLGGIQTGQIISQPLIDPIAPDFEGA